MCSSTKRGPWNSLSFANTCKRKKKYSNEKNFIWFNEAFPVCQLSTSALTDYLTASSAVAYEKFKLYTAPRAFKWYVYISFAFSSLLAGTHRLNARFNCLKTSRKPAGHYGSLGVFFELRRYSEEAAVLTQSCGGRSISVSHSIGGV